MYKTWLKIIMNCKITMKCEIIIKGNLRYNTEDYFKQPFCPVN